MHFRMFVTTTLPDGATSEEARRDVHDTLLTDDSFCGAGGRFGSPLCDWFVIGGRWSGVLTEAVIGASFRRAVVARFPEMAKDWWPHSLAEAHRDEIDALWQSHGGTGSSPYTREDGGDLGHPDDAQLLTREMYDAFLAPYEGAVRGCDDYHDLDDEPLRPDAVGRKWIVVVDYHN